MNLLSQAHEIPSKGPDNWFQKQWTVDRFQNDGFLTNWSVRHVSLDSFNSLDSYSLLRFPAFKFVWVLSERSGKTYSSRRTSISCIPEWFFTAVNCLFKIHIVREATLATILKVRHVVSAFKYRCLPTATYRERFIVPYFLTGILARFQEELLLARQQRTYHILRTGQCQLIMYRLWRCQVSIEREDESLAGSRCCTAYFNATSQTVYQFDCHIGRALRTNHFPQRRDWVRF